MDNAYKALVMAGSVLLFIIGLSVAVYNYNRVLEINNLILTNSEYYSRTAESFQFTDYYTTTDNLNTQDFKRIFNGDQVAWLIFNMYCVKTEIREIGSIDPATSEATTQTFTTQDIAYDEISVGGQTFKKGEENYIFKGDTGQNFLRYLLERKFIIDELKFDGKIKVKFVEFTN